jgi:hypothetical protein
MARRKQENHGPVEDFSNLCFGWSKVHPLAACLVGALLLAASYLLMEYRNSFAALPMLGILGGCVIASLIAVIMLMGAFAGLLSKLGGAIAPARAGDPLTDPMPYLPTSVLTPGEKKFYDILNSVVPHEQVALLTKVRLLDLVNLPAETPRWRSWFAQASQKHVDFVLCHKLDMCPFMAIELDDKSHDKPESAANDAFKDRVLPHVGIQLHRIKCQIAYDVPGLNNLIGLAVRHRNSQLTKLK